MSRNEEKAAVNAEVLRQALRESIQKRFPGHANAAPAENTPPWYRAGARVTSVGATTLKKLLQGERATISVLSKLLDRLQLRPIDLVLLDDQCRIPKCPEAYPKFEHGHFIVDLRTRAGEPKRCWCHERADLRAVLEPDDTLRLAGTLVNDFDKTFDVQGQWVGHYLLTLTALERGQAPAADTHHAITHVFTAVFDLCYPLNRLRSEDGQVLCGFWNGVTSFGTPARYRFFLSTRELEASELKELKKVLKARTILDTDEAPRA